MKNIIVEELKEILKGDPYVSNINNDDLTVVDHYDDYRGQIFNHKEVYVALFDLGNGAFSFMKELTKEEVEKY